LLFGSILALSACTAFNPAFVDLLDPTGAQGLATLDNAPGHVVIAFVNNAEVDERLLDYLESAEGGNLVLTDSEKRSLRPRMRLRVRVTFTDDSFQIIEFIDGSRNLVDQTFDVQAFPDLNQNDLSNSVVVCDVASVTLEPGTGIDVFVPVNITAYELIAVTSAGGVVTSVTFQPRERSTPQFRALQVDQVDEDGNVTLQRNIGVRDVPSPAINPLCGSVVVIAVDGVLSVPFLANVSSAPSYDREDTATAATIGGRYEFRVSVQ
jgi:hypothetical protein